VAVISTSSMQIYWA